MLVALFVWLSRSRSQSRVERANCLTRDVIIVDTLYRVGYTERHVDIKLT